MGMSRKGAESHIRRLALLSRAVAWLPARERYVVVRRYGLDGGAVESGAAIGRTLGLGRERVRAIQQRAEVRLSWLLRAVPR